MRKHRQLNEVPDGLVSALYDVLYVPPTNAELVSISMLTPAQLADEASLSRDQLIVIDKIRSQGLDLEAEVKKAKAQRH
jgi:hypothetical protein